MIKSIFIFYLEIPLRGGAAIFNIWTISPVGIGIRGKMFIKYFPEKLPVNCMIFFLQDWNFTSFRCPNFQILLYFGVPDNQVSLRFGVPDNQILLHFGVPDNCSSAPGMAKSHWIPQRVEYKRQYIFSKYFLLFNQVSDVRFQVSGVMCCVQSF